MLNDKKISLKAKGLFLWIDGQENKILSIDKISQQTKEGRKSIRSAIKELEQNGYLKRKQIKKNNKFYGYEYKTRF